MALPAAFPLAAAGDDFNRADEGPPPGASWSSPIYSGQSGLTVASNELAGAAAWKDAYITDAVGPDLDVIFTLSTLPAGANNIYLHVRLDPTRLGNDASGYALQLQPGGTYGLNIVRYLTGTPTTIYTGTPVAVTAGTKFGIRVHGQRIDIYRQPPAGAWTLIGGVNDSLWTGAAPAGTHVGMEWNDATMRVDDFQWISLGSGESASSPPLGNHPMQSSLLRSTMQISGAQPNAAAIWSDWLWGTAPGGTTFLQTLSATGAGVASMVRSVNKVLSLPGSGAPTIRRDVSKTITLSGSGAPTIVKSVQKILAATGAGTASMTMGLLFTKAMTATGTGVASMSRSVSKIVSASGVGTATIARSVFKTISLSGTGAPTILKSATKTLSASGSGAATLLKMTAKALSSSGSGSPAIVMMVGKQIDATGSGSGDLSTTFIPGVPPGPATGATSISMLVLRRKKR